MVLGVPDLLPGCNSGQEGFPRKSQHVPAVRQRAIFLCIGNSRELCARDPRNKKPTGRHGPHRRIKPLSERLPDDCIISPLGTHWNKQSLGWAGWLPVPVPIHGRAPERVSLFKSYSRIAQSPRRTSQADGTKMYSQKAPRLAAPGPIPRGPSPLEVSRCCKGVRLFPLDAVQELSLVWSALSTFFLFFYLPATVPFCNPVHPLGTTSSSSSSASTYSTLPQGARPKGCGAFHYPAFEDFPD